MEKTDFVVIGSGIAGLRAAIEAASCGEVRVLTKSRADESSSQYAQGGIAAAISDEDEIGLHYEDTIRAGDGLCDESAVRRLVEEGPARIQELIEWGAQFDREGTKLAFTREAAHSRRRVLHAGGDSTGHEIVRTLIHKAGSLKNIHLLTYTFALELLVEDAGCSGVRYLDEKSGEIRELEARSVLLATGGLGQLYRETTNPAVATGDGCALAFEAGAALADMEFVQFHPTALKRRGAPHFLLSEALRGEGGRLRNAQGEFFMPRYHPEAELAPRDVVARAIVSQCRESNSEVVFLDLTHLDPGFIRRRFPRIFQTCLHFGLDITGEWIPVYPAAHYMMGGVLSDCCGRTTVAGLFAAGEVACNGVHGANRLASNSLLEGLVYGARAGEAMAQENSGFSPSVTSPLSKEEWPSEAKNPEGDSVRKQIQTLMSENAGVLRTGEGLRAALREFHRIGFSTCRKRADQETNHLLVNARLIVGTALLRTESRGAHSRLDHQRRDDEQWKCRILVRYDPASKSVLYERLPIR